MQKDYTVISVSKEAAEGLRKRIGKKMLETGRRYTVTGVILELLELTEKYEKMEESE